MKKTVLAFAITLLPFALSAQEAEAPASEAATPPLIEVIVSLRYKDTVVYSGRVELADGSTAQIADSSGTARSSLSDSALAALMAADLASPDFSLSDLSYFEGFSSFYIRCIELSSLSKTACENWQYVVNDSYPAVGADKYDLSGGDSVYFYFGTPRRVVIEAQSALKDSPVVVRSESYDYVNDAWTPLPGATIGATQPNPDDPYSPTVVSEAITDSDGKATLSLGIPGLYGIGLAMDFYSLLENLEITAPAQAEPVIPSPTTRSGGSRSPAPVVPITQEGATTSAAVIVDETIVSLDMPIEEFVRRYRELQKQVSFAVAAKKTVPPPIVATPKTDSSQSASVIEAALPVKNESWLKRAFRRLGF